MNLQRSDRFTLVEALDRLIDKGVAVSGDVSISVADIDLVYLGVRLLLSSAEDVPGLRGIRRDTDRAAGQVASGAANDVPDGHEAEAPAAPALLEHHSGAEPVGRSRDVIDVESTQSGSEPRRLMDIDPAQIERDLCRLVLTIVELLRQLMERQAVRRMEGGSLREDDLERLGTAFARLDEKMEELKSVFGLDDEDLNIDLGPLGTLV